MSRTRRALIVVICIQIALLVSLGAAIAIGHAREGSNATPPRSAVTLVAELT
jgi:hypothetical protein